MIEFGQLRIRIVDDFGCGGLNALAFNFAYIVFSINIFDEINVSILIAKIRSQT